MLLNLSNHPSALWSENQMNEALIKYKSVKDIPFPDVPPAASESGIKKLAFKYGNICLKELKKSNDKNNAVHIMGEFTFSFSVVLLLIRKKIICVASTTKRISKEKSGVKTTVFYFVKFREYKI